MVANKEKELELNWAKSSANSLNTVKETLINNPDAFSRLFVDDVLFSTLGEKEFFTRLQQVFAQ